MRRSTIVQIALVVAVALTGCASSGDLARVQAQENLINAKADQALREAQAAKAAADAAKQQSDEAKQRSDAAALRAETAEKRAEERERVAQEKEQRADAIFQHSMRK